MTITIADAMRCMGSGAAILEARVLLRHVLERDDGYLIAHAEQALTAGQQEAFEALAERRRRGEPIAYLTGRREFYGLEFKVTPAVLIPRPETELLVERVLERVPTQAAAQVLELGTGSGCVAIAIAQRRPRARVVAVDDAAEAVALARENAARHAVPNLSIVCGDWFAAVPAERFDVIAANPPYIAAGDPHLAVSELQCEPRRALVAGAEGTECIAAIIAAARDHLSEDGWLLFEHGHDQGARSRALLAAAGFSRQLRTWCDLAGIERVSGAQLDRLSGRR